MRISWVHLGFWVTLGGCSAWIDDPPTSHLKGRPGAPSVQAPEPLIVVAEPLHSLNRAEYDNTVRDLLGTSLAPARAFPADTSVGGFDNAADALTLPASLFSLGLTRAPMNFCCAPKAL